jgi:hypothetical protein
MKSNEGEGFALSAYMKRYSITLYLLMQSMSNNQLLVV